MKSIISYARPDMPRETATMHLFRVAPIPSHANLDAEADKVSTWLESCLPAEVLASVAERLAKAVLA